MIKSVTNTVILPLYTPPAQGSPEHCTRARKVVRSVRYRIHIPRNISNGVFKITTNYQIQQSER